ncbi:hypothetical protein tinsulaeT_28070 [Thalassotalea insulae]|uniref:LPXTG cell wall anchor domain-containing protein n=1 Tax=Thalassotalea insulae TaxID=2056778 RepID=A0ABQ6GU87_9GAMM|nr:hypothetical protein [Thalassotalea insulae]GLX79467.1 hypothetical protein tinsulaeT_28070 [Thalassotalea insulae]
MSLQKIIATMLIIMGIIGLAYGGFSYTSDVHQADIGSLHMSLSETQDINIPIWAGVTFIIAGGVLLLLPKKL